jgi:DnaJ-class molecular chaperone
MEGKHGLVRNGVIFIIIWKSYSFLIKRRKVLRIIKILILMNPFKILGITSAASKAQIRAAYFQKAKELHPDSPTGSPQKFK